MVYLEKLPSSLTARSILKFVQSDTAKSCTGWFTGKCLDELFGNKKIEIQLQKMNTLNEELERIKQDTSNAIKVKTDCQNFNNRIFQAEMGINHKFQLMQTVLSNESKKERYSEVLRLRNGILDTNSGVLNNLAVINKSLVGEPLSNPAGNGLLEMWYKRVYNSMIQNPMSAKMCEDYVLKYLNKAVILQFKGILLLTGANGNSGFCLSQFDLFESNLKSQIDKMVEIVPPFMKYLTDPNEQNIFVLRPVLGGKFEPFEGRRGSRKKLVNEYFRKNIDDGKWIFEKSPTFDTDGSLLIAGSSTGGKSYMSASKANIAECVSEKWQATPFYVIPLEFKERKMKIIICKSDSNDHRFLGSRLKFINVHDDIKVENSLELINERDQHEFSLSFDCV